MKTLVILFAFGKNFFRAFEKSFNVLENNEEQKKSAFDLVLFWANAVDFKCEKEIFVFCQKDFEDSVKKIGVKNLITLDSEITNAEICQKIATLCEEQKAQSAVFSFGDCPFLNKNLAERIFSLHKESAAEYTFCDGYASSLSCEVLDAGTAKILSEFSKNNENAKIASKMPFKNSRGGIFSILQADLNTFEVETEVSEDDFRMLRLDFSCEKKSNFVSCKNMLFALEKTTNSGKKIDFQKICNFDPEEFCHIAQKNVHILKTLPTFYNLQIASVKSWKEILVLSGQEEVFENAKTGFLKNFWEKSMNFCDFKNLVQKISEFSCEAVICVSAFCEALENADFVKFVLEILSYENLCVFIETSAKNLSKKMLSEICAAKNASERVFWAICADWNEKYLKAEKKSEDEKIENPLNRENLLKIEKTILQIKEFFPKTVFPQFVRSQKTEENLENFFRFWSDKKSCSKGNLIIQKFNDFCGAVKNLKKTADLSPLERFPCWHLRRDLTILCDGTTLRCFQCSLQKENLDFVIGNAFSQDLSEIWQKIDKNLQNQIEKNYEGFCEECDEWYTFNF